MRFLEIPFLNTNAQIFSFLSLNFYFENIAILFNMNFLIYCVNIFNQDRDHDDRLIIENEHINVIS